MKKIYTYTSLILAAIFLLSCAEKENIALETKDFTSIFDSKNFTTAYTPLDVKQTPDGGYLVLAERSLDSLEVTGIYLLKADKFGNFVKVISPGDSIINPIGPLSLIADNYYFFCMSSSNEDYSQVKLASLDANLSSINIKSVGNLTYPQASSLTGTTLLLLSYNNEDKTTVLSEITANGTPTQNTAAYTVGIGADSEGPIIEHHLKEGRQFPFAVGKTSDGTYFYNGFYEYNFSLVFTNLNPDNPLGFVQGQSDHGGFSTVVPISGSKFAAARFNFGDNYLLPNVTLTPSDQSTSPDKGGLYYPELTADAPVKIYRATIDSKNVLIYGSNTISKQIGLYYFDEAAGTFLGSRYIGFANPFEVGAIANTADGGLIICGTTFLAGRFPRICLIKISKEEIESDIKE